MKRFITILLCFSSFYAFSQKTTLQFEGRAYQGVDFTFTTYVSYGDDRLFPDKDIRIIIAKKDEGGLISLSVELPADKDLCDYFHKCGISGDITIELADGDTIVCKDLGNGDFIDGIASAVYRLTPQNMEQIRKANIEIIRFYMRTFNTKGNYIAANFHHTMSSTPDEFTRKKERVTITKVHKLVKKL